VFKILELATERVMHGWRQIVYRMRIRTLCSRFSSLQQKNYTWVEADCVERESWVETGDNHRDWVMIIRDPVGYAMGTYLQSSTDDVDFWTILNSLCLGNQLDYCETGAGNRVQYRNRNGAPHIVALSFLHSQILGAAVQLHVRGPLRRLIEKHADRKITCAAEETAVASSSCSC